MMQVLGLEVGDLPSGTVVCEVVVLVKMLDADGHIGLIERSSAGLTTWEALGMAITFADDMRAQLRGSWTPDPEND